MADSFVPLIKAFVGTGKSTRLPYYLVITLGKSVTIV